MLTEWLYDDKADGFTSKGIKNTICLTVPKYEFNLNTCFDKLRDFVFNNSKVLKYWDDNIAFDSNALDDIANSINSDIDGWSKKGENEFDKKANSTEGSIYH
jgi:hypothetical protein